MNTRRVVINIGVTLFGFFPMVSFAQLETTERSHNAQQKSAPLTSAALSSTEDVDKPFPVNRATFENLAAESPFLSRFRLYSNARFRYQFLGKDDFERDANSATVRLYSTLEFDLLDNVTFLVEGEAVTAIVDNFNDGSGNNPEFPIIPDPNGLELNRLLIAIEAVPETRITLGRQRVALDDSRFIGAFGFRQNDQTFDAARVQTRLVGPGLLDVGYFNQANRPLGNDNPNGQFEGDSYFINYGVQTPFGRVAAFHYALDLVTDPISNTSNTAINTDLARQGMDVSNQTTGARILGRRHWDDFGVIWEGAFARQTDFAGNIADYAANYGLAELTIEPKQWTFKGRAEILGSGDGQGFQTPLGTLHKFQGFADIFLTTPDDGVRDYSVLAQYSFGQIGPFTAVKAFARHHWFEADTDGRNFGSELNVSLSARIGRTRIALEFADYDADQFARDNRAAFLTVETSF